ncbi:hypothetical protein ACM46_02725 [Chryseobacterium angstadtii]|uniref:DUF2141 domain-containing protein n=1 Tax=Chryseobacterium angstadtii TaxID=558151 RepID=A0A0J7LC08_9FLAO|nr:DUF2141 domain-containing protein [Chryseobacterium angstadtii]KMQ66465.1 hypothetical protein ACM46_02725 [Chryseobacterium angstadtii]
MKQLIFLCILIFNFSHSQQKKHVSISFTTSEAKKGTLYIAVYDNSEKFLQTAVARFKTNYNGSKKRFVIKDLEEGKSISVSAYLDENADGKLDKNFLGIPLEPYGFSQNARGSFGPPKFEEASFTVKANNSLTINLK